MANPHPVAALSHDVAARRIQHMAHSRRVCRAAKLLARLPPDLREHTVWLCRPVELNIDVVSKEARLVEALFLDCGIRSDMQHSSSFYELEHFDSVRNCYELAALHLSALDMDRIREYLNTALQYEQRWQADRSLQWHKCRAAMHDFARTVLQSSCAHVDDPCFTRSPLEAAIVCTGA